MVWSNGPANTIAVYGIKSLRYSGYAVHDAPLAAYGFVTCAVGAHSGLSGCAGPTSIAAAVGDGRT